MVDGVIAPQPLAVESAVNPVHHEIRADQEDHRLQPERQSRERAVAIVVEGDQTFGSVNVEQECGSNDQEPDAQVAREQRNDEPVTKVGNEIALAPPVLTWIARPEHGQNAEDQCEGDGHRHDLNKC